MCFRGYLFCFLVDENNHCKNGGPGHPVAAVDRGREMFSFLIKLLMSQIKILYNSVLYQV